MTAMDTIDNPDLSEEQLLAEFRKIYSILIDDIVGHRKASVLTALSFIIAELVMLRTDEASARADAATAYDAILGNISTLALARAPVGMMN